MSKRTFIAIGLLVAAMALCSSVLGQGATEQSMLEAAQKVYLTGDFGTAKDLLDKIIKAYPRSYSAYFLRGEIKMVFLRDFEGALADTEYSIKLAPKVQGIERVYSNRGLIFQFTGQDDKALADFEKAISVNPNYPPPHNGRAVILEKKKRIDEALKEFNTFIKLEPNPIAGYVGRGDILFKKHDLQGALSDNTKVVNGDQQFPSNWIRRGIVYGTLGSWESSFSDIRKGFDLLKKPENRFSRIDIALTDLDTFIGLYPKDANAYAIRGLISLLQSKDSAAEIDLAKSYEIDPSLRDQLKELIEFIRKTRQ